MIVVLLNSYIALLALFVWLRFIPFNLFCKLSPVLVLLALLVGLFIPMGGARHRDPRRCCAIRCRSSRQRASDVGPFRGHPQRDRVGGGSFEASVFGRGGCVMRGSAGAWPSGMACCMYLTTGTS